MQLEDLLNHFSAVSEHADGGYLARCAAHADSNPSLRIWRGENLTVRMTCRAGCSTSGVIAAAGLRWPDLFNVSGEGSTVPAAKQEAVGIAQIAGLRMWLDSLPVGDGWYAQDRFGIGPDDAKRLGLCYWAASETYPDLISRSFARFPRLVVPLNDFAGVARGAQGRDLSGNCPARWLSLRNPQGLRWGAYGVLRGTGGHGVTIVTEGPGDGLTAVTAGYDAVAIRGAALAGSPELVAELAAGLRDSARIVVCGDADDAGAAFAAKLANGLAAHGLCASALVPPEAGWDLTDWRAADAAGFPLRLQEAIGRTKPTRKIIRAKAIADAAAAFLD